MKKKKSHIILRSNPSHIFSQGGFYNQLLLKTLKTTMIFHIMVINGET